MQENNYPELISQMDTLGLGRDPSLYLSNAVYRELPCIELHVRKTHGEDQLDAFLHFSKIEDSGKYLFTHWDLQVRNQEQQPNLKQTFTVVNNKNPITLMEGYNLLHGRSIFKAEYINNGEKQPSWCALDFKNTDQDGNFTFKILGNQYNLEAQVLRYPIKEIEANMERRWLIQALEEGHRVPVTIQKEFDEQKVYIEASPRFNAVKFHNSHNRPINISEVIRQDQHENKAIKQTEHLINRSHNIRF